MHPSQAHCDNSGFGAQAAFISLLNSIHSFLLFPATGWYNLRSLKYHFKSLEARRTAQSFVRGEFDIRKHKASLAASVDVHFVFSLYTGASSIHSKMGYILDYLETSSSLGSVIPSLPPRGCGSWDRTLRLSLMHADMETFLSLIAGFPSHDNVSSAADSQIHHLNDFFFFPIWETPVNFPHPPPEAWQEAPKMKSSISRRIFQ